MATSTIPSLTASTDPTRSVFARFVFSALVILSGLLPAAHLYNAPLFRFINGANSPLTDHFWLGITTLGDGLAVCVILGAFLVVNPRVTVVGLVTLALCTPAMHLLKWLFSTPRPVMLIEDAHIIGPLLRSGSFPSGHTSTVVAAAVVVAYYSRSRVVAGMALAWACLVGFSRIFVGAHFPRDVIGGAILALLSFLLVQRYAARMIESRTPEEPFFAGRRFTAMFAIACGADLVLVFVHAPRFAESPTVAASVGLAVLAFQAWGVRPPP
jgi:membrane-associated phospholipid phosphatase